MSAAGAPGSMAGRAVLITGGTGGIGKAAAIGLAALGARVAITGRERERAEAAAAEIASRSGNPAVDVFVGDLSSQADVRRLAGEVLAAYPRFPEFLRRKLHYDPDQRFQSEWYRHYREMFAPEVSHP